MRHNWQPVVVEEVNYKMHSYSSINTFRVLVLLVIFFFCHNTVIVSVSIFIATLKLWLLEMQDPLNFQKKS